MTIKSFLLIAFGILAVPLIGIAAINVFDAIASHRANTSFLTNNAIEELLLRAAGDLAIERGLSNAPLHAPDPLPAESRAEIARVRASADAAVRDGMGRLRNVPQMTVALRLVDDFERSHKDFDAFRQRVDQALGASLAQRPSDVVDQFAPAITSLIDRIGKLRTTLEALTQVPSAESAQFVQLRHLVSVMAEEAGRERAVFGGNIAQRRPFSRDDVRELSEHRGHVQLVWDAIEAVRQRSDLPASLSEAIATVDREFIRNLTDLRSAVLARAEDGQYPVSGRDWVDRSGAALATILKLSAETGNVARGAAEAAATRIWWQVVANLAVMIGAVVITVSCFALMLGRVTRPLMAMTNAMGELANGKFDVVLPGLGRSDEIGDMAQAIEDFKVKAAEKARREAERQHAGERAAAAEKAAMDERREAEKKAAAQREEAARKAAMIKLANEFEAAIGGIIDTVSSDSTELEAAAKTLAKTADVTQKLSTVVASASEEASANVQSVASATEEMSSSVGEISRQVQASGKIANQAVKQAEQTDARINELSNAAARIGDVVKLITSVAEQTNLLALNATIEAARAGEAGRGFAVVAHEVKALAAQTAKATEEISSQISSMQMATEESVKAIKEIGGTIGRISEISSTIAAAVEEQGAATQEISRNVGEAAKGTAQVAANIIDVNRGASETGSASAQVLSSAQSLSNESNRLKAEVGKFLSTVRAA